MEFNQSRAIASEVYLIEKWNDHSGTPDQRRAEIFQEFVKLGMRERWKWHARAETYEFSAQDRKVLDESREYSFRAIASWIGGDQRRVMVTDSTHPMELSDLEYRTDLEGDPMLVCTYDGDPFDVLPELAYSMTAFDDPDDVEEARREKRDQSLWVSGVFWIRDKIVWIDEIGVTIREGRFGRDELKESAETFERYRPFESAWWTEATKIGKYARDEWWL